MDKKNQKLLATGLIGTVIAAVCCFTPALVILLGAVGLSAWLSWADLIFLPLLALSLALTAYALVRLKPAKKS